MVGPTSTERESQCIVCVTLRFMCDRVMCMSDQDQRLSNQLEPDPDRRNTMTYQTESQRLDIDQRPSILESSKHPLVSYLTQSYRLDQLRHYLDSGEFIRPRSRVHSRWDRPVSCSSF